MDDDELLYWMQVGFDSSDRIREAIANSEPSEAYKDWERQRAGAHIEAADSEKPGA
ncbi:hypothetical protein [Streptomyces prasinus]